MKFVLIFILILLFIVFYDGYLKKIIYTLQTYGKIIFGVGVCVYLFYAYYKSPEEFSIALEFVKSYFLRSDDFMTKQLDRISVGNTKQGRSVSNLLKKKVAAKQEWKCGHCKSILDASYEVDHIVGLYRGGSNSEDNLVALCRNCHGKKTVEERLNND